MIELLTKLKDLSATDWLAVIGGLTALLKFFETILNVNSPTMKLFSWLFKPISKAFHSIRDIRNDCRRNQG